MTLEKLLLSIIVDDRMGRLNSAIEEVYGVNAVGAVYSEDEELIQYTEVYRNSKAGFSSCLSFFCLVSSCPYGVSYP